MGEFHAEMQLKWDLQIVSDMQELVMECVRGYLTNGVVLSSWLDLVRNLATAPVSKSDHYIL